MDFQKMFQFKLKKILEFRIEFAMNQCMNINLNPLNTLNPLVNHSHLLNHQFMKIGFFSDFKLYFVSFLIC